MPEVRISSGGCRTLECGDSRHAVALCEGWLAPPFISNPQPASLPNIRSVHVTGSLARMERAKPIVVQTFDVVARAEELLLRQSYGRSPAHSGGAVAFGAALDKPNLLCTRPDVYIESWGYAGRR
jgi:hypothetical protein